MNTYFLFLVRRDPVLQLTAHLAAGIVALVFVTSFATPKPPRLSPATHPAAATTVAASGSPAASH